MDNHDERSPLVGGSRVSFGTSTAAPPQLGDSRFNDQQALQDDSGIDSEEEQDITLNDMMAKFGTSVGSLGLGGGFHGAPLMRRGSVSSMHVQPPRQRRRSSIRAQMPEEDTKTPTQYQSITIQVGNGHSHGLQKASDIKRKFAAGKPGTSPFLGGVSRARFWAVFSSILLVYLVACFDSTLMASSHPVITSYFHASNSASWLSTAFLLTSTAFQPVFGRVSDAVGRRSPFLFSIFMFGVGTVWCALARNIFSFIMARAVCGFGAGGAMAMGAIINSDMVPIHIRGSYQSLLNLAFGIGSSLGAALGGFLADALGWRWEFGIQVPAIMVALFVAWITVPDDLGPQLSKREKSNLLVILKHFDTTGSLSQAIGVTFLVVGLNLGGNVLPWSHPVIIIALVASLISASILIVAEKRAARPIMPLEFLSSSPRSNLVFSNFFASMTINTIMFNLPLYFQAVLLDSATRSGLRLVLPFMFNMAAGFSTGFIITWSQKLKPTLLCGYSLLVIGSVGLSVIESSFPGWAYTLIIAVASMGQGFAYPSVSLSMLATSTTEDLAVATSTLILWRSLGIVMGVAGSSLIVQNALVYYLHQFVNGPEKNEFRSVSVERSEEQVIHEVRKSIEAVIRIPEAYRADVMHAYSASLRLSFIFAGCTSAIALLLVLRIHLPQLSNQSEKSMDDDRDEE